MRSRISMLVGTLLGVGLMVAAMWVWQRGPHLAFDATRPDITLWAIRSAAVAAVALAQTMMLVLVVGNLYRARMLDAVLRAATTAVFLVALISAVALGLAGR